MRKRILSSSRCYDTADAAETTRNTQRTARESSKLKRLRKLERERGEKAANVIGEQPKNEAPFGEVEGAAVFESHLRRWDQVVRQRESNGRRVRDREKERRRARASLSKEPNATTLGL